MDRTKCYQQKADKKYLGKFVKTEDYYPDGPWRGGRTTHTFSGISGNIEVVGKYNDNSDYEVTNCLSGGKKSRRSNKKRRLTRRNNRR
jgi:hypothetical protein